MSYLGWRAVSSTVYILFTTHDTDGAAIAPSDAFEAADVILYKDGSGTQRTSQAGWTMASPFDSIVGLHQLAIDLSDNTDAGFYAEGSHYKAVLSPSSETVDALSVVRVIAEFDIGVQPANTTQFGGTAGTFSSGRPEVNTTHAAGTAWGSGAITAASIASDAIAAAKIATGAITAAKFAAGALDAAALAADAGTEIGTAVWATAARTLTAATNITSTGGTTVPQTGDSYARIGAAGVSLTDLGGMSTTMKAQVNTEADTALADYDPPTRAEATSDVNSVLNVLKGLVLLTGTIGSTGNDTTHVHLPGLTYGNDEIISYYLVLFDVSTSEYHVRDITDWVLATELATVDTLPFTPQNATDTYWLLSAQKTVGAGGGDATEAKQDTIIALIGTPVTDLAADIAAIEAQTDDIGVAGAGLTAVPWNAAWDAEVQSEVADALGVYDPPTKAELDTAIGLVTTKTDNLPSDPADASVIAGRFDTLDTSVADLPTNAELSTALGSADDAVLAQVALVKAKTDNLPSDPADASVIAGLIAALETKVDTIDDLLDTEVAAIKTVVDAILVDTTALNDTALPDSIPAVGSLPTLKQAAYVIHQYLLERDVVSTTATVYKADGTTPLLTQTLDDGSNPTAVSRTT